MTNETGTRPRALRWRRIAIEMLLVVAVIAGIRAWQQRGMVSGVPPVLQGTTLAGRIYRLPARPDRPVLVHFWATWCPVCRAEQGSIADIARDHPNMITIAMQSGGQEDVKRFMREKGIAFPVVNDADGSISSSWGVRAVPASFIIAPDGQICFTEVGFTTGIGLRLRLWLAGI